MSLKYFNYLHSWKNRVRLHLCETLYYATLKKRFWLNLGVWVCVELWIKAVLLDEKYFLLVNDNHEGFDQVICFGPLVSFDVPFLTLDWISFCVTWQEILLFNKRGGVAVFFCCSPEALCVYANAK